jgi:hypothetical protein
MNRVPRAPDISKLAADHFVAISRLFSSSVIRELARTGKSPLFARLARQTHLFNCLSASERVFSLFETAFSLLKRQGLRDEYVYKAALTHKILLGKHSLQTASMLNEFRVGECKADVAILNGTATVYEIKSERDSLARLQRQVAAYARVFARIYVIAAENHVDAVMASVPTDVGVLCLNKRHNISTLRDSLDCPERTSPAAIFDAIRTDEARRVLAAEGIAIPTVPNTLLHSVLRELFVKLEPRQAHEGMVRVLKKTRNLMPLSELVAQLPPSLKPAALSVPLRKADHSRLVTAVNTPLEKATAWA